MNETEFFISISIFIIIFFIGVHISSSKGGLVGLDGGLRVQLLISCFNFDGCDVIISIIIFENYVVVL